MLPLDKEPARCWQDRTEHEVHQRLCSGVEPHHPKPIGKGEERLEEGGTSFNTQ